MPLLSLSDAGYRYPGSGRWVFRHFDMTVEPGEVIRVLGRNGSGKTTVLKVLSGLLNLTEGKRHRQSGTKVAYMDQFSGEMLARDLTIAEQFKAASVADSSSDIAPVEMLGEFGLDLQDRLEEFIGHLSGGQRQIIALLCTMAAGANVLCLDEFTSSLDERSLQTAEKLLTRIKATTDLVLILVGHSGTAVKTDRELDISSFGDTKWERNRTSSLNVNGPES